jgi:electron transfer flavoprotein-quinone oxidoreductase
VSDGALLAGDAAGLVLNNGVHLEGTNMAVESGYQAGRAVGAAVDGDDGSVDDRALATYPEELADSFVVQNLQHYDFFQELAVEDREFLFSELPRALADAETEYFAVDRDPKEAHAEAAKDRLLDAAGGYVGAAKRAWKYRKLLS